MKWLARGRSAKSMKFGALLAAMSVFLFLFMAGIASASRVTLIGDERVNVIGGALPGINYTTPLNGVDYQEVGGAGAHPGEMLMTGSIPALNWHTTGAPGANVNNAVNLDFSVQAALLGVSMVNTGGTIYNIEMTFGTATPGAGNWDLTVTDPDDSNIVIFQGDLTAGDFFGSSVKAITATAIGVDIATNDNPVFTAQAFVIPDYASEYGSLFHTDVGDPLAAAFSFTQVWQWNPGFTTIAAALAGSSTLISNTSQASGSLFGVDSAAFIPVPEPGTGLLVGLGVLLLGARKRR